MASPPDATPSPHVVFEDVDMTFGERRVLQGLSCAFPKGQISVILGGSGSGKSTMLRLIGGLIEPDRGSIVVDGTDVVKASADELREARMKIGMMFQHGALLDSMTVFDNLAFPLREHSDAPEEEIRRRVHKRLANVGLAQVDDLYPGQLSGGMTKRVALARAIILEPVILLCDEPFSGLDPITSKRIEMLLRDVNRKLGITIVAVSHDPPSTMRMADHALVLLPDGKAEGSPQQLHDSADPRVSNLLSSEVDERIVQLAALVESTLSASASGSITF